MTDMTNTENTNTTEIETTETTPIEQHDEVKNPAAVLKKNKELLAKNAELTTRIAELESKLGEATASQEKLQNDFADFHIRRPLARLAEEISPLPDIWMAEFSKHFDLKVVENDDLGIFHKDGTRCKEPGRKGEKGGGDPVKFTAKGVWWLLCRDYLGVSSTPDSKRWVSMMHWHGPSGGGAPGSSGGSYEPSKPKDPAPAPKKAFGIQ